MTGSSGPETRAYSTMAQDGLVRFHIDGERIHGRLIRLGATLDEIIGAHAYPPSVSRIVAEAVALVAIIGAGMKFSGRLSLQIRSDGPVSILVADYFVPGGVRCYARYKEADLPGGDVVPFKELIGKGHFSMTLDQGPDMDQYQGVVGLDGDTLAACAIEYLKRSEQVESTVMLAAGELINADGTSWRAGGLILQHLPENGAPFLDDDGESLAAGGDTAWGRAAVFAETVEPVELTDPSISHEQLLYRLFHEDGVRVEPRNAVPFYCTCSRERVEGVLMQYTIEELRSMLEDGKVRARCEFCSRAYAFALDDLKKS